MAATTQGRNTLPRYHYFIALLSTSFLGATAGYAQPSEQKGIEEITVTAQKREEGLQSVPVAVSAVSGEQLDRMKALRLTDLQGTVPNVQIGHFSNTPHTAVFNIRGMGVIEPDPYAGNVVSVVVDGVPQYFNTASLLDLFDIERVEILKGPQGTLFGANSTGGVVNVITRRPTGEFGGRAQMSVGNYARRDLNLALDFPIIEDTLAGKAVVMHHQRDGWHTNIVDGSDMGSRDVTAMRGYLHYMGNESLDATLITEYVRARNGSPIAVNGAVPGEAIYIEPGTSPGPGMAGMYPSPCAPAGTSCSAPSRYVSANSSVRDRSNMDTYGATLEVNWSSPVGDVTSITGYKQFDLDEYTDQDATPFDLFATRRKTEGWQFSQELRNTYQVRPDWEVMIGGFAMITNYEHYQNALFGFALPGLRVLTPHEQDNWSASIFMQNYFDLTDNLRLQAGLRYTHEHTEMEASVQNFLNFDGPSVFSGDTLIGGFTVKEDNSWDNVGGKIGLDYQLTEDFLTYGYYARGFKSGGFVGRLGIPEDIGPFEEEYVDTIEVGAKTDWFDNRLRVNVALFQNWYKDIQLASLYFTEDAQGNTIQGNSILNAAKAETRGVELDLIAAPVTGLTLNLSMAYLYAEYTDFPFLDPLTLQQRDLDGYHLQDAPEWTATIGFNYAVPRQVGPGSLEFGMRYKFTDEKYNTAIDNSPRSRVQRTHITDAHMEWMHESERWSIELWGRNIFDQRYIASVIDVPPVFANVNYAAPREWGASLKYNW